MNRRLVVCLGLNLACAACQAVPPGGPAAAGGTLEQVPIAASDETGAPAEAIASALAPTTTSEKPLPQPSKTDNAASIAGGRPAVSSGGGGGGGGGGGSTPVAQPAVPTTGAARIDLSLQPADAPNWTLWPPLRKPRAGLVAERIGTELVAVEGAARGSYETLALVDRAATGWQLYEPDGNTRGLSVPGFGVHQDHLFVAGGLMVGSVGRVIRYGTGGTPQVLPGSINPTRAPASFTSGNRLFLAGGEAQGNVVSQTQVLNLDTLALQLAPDMPHAVAGAACAQTGSRAWILGGYSRSADGNLVAHSRVMVFDTVQNAWRSSDDGLPGAPPALPAARHSGAAAVWDGKIYLVGGQDSGGALAPSLLCLDPAAPNPIWQEATRLPTPRALLAVVATEGRLFTMGGLGEDRLPLTTVEVYRL